MAGSTFGTAFSITTWGESHGAGVGVVIDGCPAGLSLSESDIQAFLDRRRPGQSVYTTPRKESDTVSILSGIFEGKTTGTPISLVVYNETQRSKDYSAIMDIYRPGHADYTFDKKYGFRVTEAAAEAQAVKQSDVLPQVPLPLSCFPSLVFGFSHLRKRFTISISIMKTSMSAKSQKMPFTCRTRQLPLKQAHFF